MDYSNIFKIISGENSQDDVLTTVKHYEHQNCHNRQKVTASLDYHDFQIAKYPWKIATIAKSWRHAKIDKRSTQLYQKYRNGAS